MSGPRRVEIQRRLPAPIGEVFRWWTVADRLEEWMSPVGNVEAHVDLRVGGAFRITMKLPDAAAESHQGGWGKMLDRLAGADARCRYGSRDREGLAGHGRGRAHRNADQSPV